MFAKLFAKCLPNQILLNFIKLFLQASKSTGIKKRSIENSFEVEDVAHGFRFFRHNHQPTFRNPVLRSGYVSVYPKPHSLEEEASFYRDIKRLA